jgi:ribosomal protein S18 acetylase RimI-like enzyme
MKKNMKLKSIITLSILYASCISYSSEPVNNITIRPATLDDLDAINNITHESYHKHFKPIFSHLLSPEQNLEDFISEKITFQQNATKEFITKQLNQENYGLIIAQETTPTCSNIIGYCRFNQKNQHNVHIYFLGVNELFRRNKIGTELLFAAIKTFDDVTHCTLRTLAANNDAAHTFYQKHGFEHKGFVSLDLTTGAISTDPTAPATHAEYYLEIQK